MPCIHLYIRNSLHGSGSFSLLEVLGQRATINKWQTTFNLYSNILYNQIVLTCFIRAWYNSLFVWISTISIITLWSRILISPTGGYYSDSLAFASDSCKRCPDGSFVHLSDAPGKSHFDCKACPRGESLIIYGLIWICLLQTSHVSYHI